MKSYLFEHDIIGAGGSRHELYVPGVGIFWPEFDKVITDSEKMSKMQERVNKIYDQMQNGLGKKVLSYELIAERDIPLRLIEDFVKWTKSEEISREGRKESGKKLIDLFGVKEERFDFSMALKNFEMLLERDSISQTQNSLS